MKYICLETSDHVPHSNKELRWTKHPRVASILLEIPMDRAFPQSARLPSVSNLDELAKTVPEELVALLTSQLVDQPRDRRRGFLCANPTCQSDPTPPKFRCSRCKVASYCSTECQKLAWPAHKASCVSAATRGTRDPKRIKTELEEKAETVLDLLCGLLPHYLMLLHKALQPSAGSAGNAVLVFTLAADLVPHILDFLTNKLAGLFMVDKILMEQGTHTVEVTEQLWFKGAQAVATDGDRWGNEFAEFAGKVARAATQARGVGVVVEVPVDNVSMSGEGNEQEAILLVGVAEPLPAAFEEAAFLDAIKRAGSR